MSSGGPGSDTEESQDRPYSRAPERDEPEEQESEDEEDEEEDQTLEQACGSNSGNVPQQNSSRPEQGERTPASGVCDSIFSWIWKRSIRRGPYVDPSRDNFRTMTSLYASMNPASDSVNLNTQTHGAVFNLEYSPDGYVKLKLVPR